MLDEVSQRLDRHLSFGILTGGDWSWCALAFFCVGGVALLVGLGILELDWSVFNIY